ncbi:terminase small subunit [Aliikangiella maris]|uniref:Terminase small subunit n=2 Tax=Aliikangiella maris TaxID=3162458 RepID=A0ABV2BTE2_9GAMM
MRSSNFLRQSKRRQNRSFVSHSSDFHIDDKVIGKDTLANLMDVTVTCVERWIRDGMPVEQRGDQFHDWVFDLAMVQQWQETQAE